MKDPTVQSAIRLHNAYKHGIMPVDGGLSEQSSLYEEVMFHCSSLEAEAQEWDIQQRTPKQTKRK